MTVNIKNSFKLTIDDSIIYNVVSAKKGEKSYTVMYCPSGNFQILKGDLHEGILYGGFTSEGFSSTVQAEGWQELKDEHKALSLNQRTIEILKTK